MPHLSLDNHHNNSGNEEISTGMQKDELDSRYTQKKKKNRYAESQVADLITSDYTTTSLQDTAQEEFGQQKKCFPV